MSESAAKPDPWKVWVALGTVYGVWGSTYLAIRVMVETMPPLLSTGLRFFSAGALLFVFLLVRGGPQRVRLSGAEIGASTIVGGALVLGGTGLVAVGEQDVPSGLAALIVASVPLWVAVWRRLTGERIPPQTLIGVLAGFAGVALLVLPGETETGAGAAGSLVIGVASFLWATGSFFGRRLPAPGDALVATAYQMLCGGAVAILAGVLFGEASHIRWESFTAPSLAAFLYLVVAGSIVGFGAYSWLLSHAPISRVATHAYVNPLVAIVLGWLVLSERLSLPIVVGAAVIIASVALTVRREGEHQAASPSEETDVDDGDRRPSRERFPRPARRIRELLTHDVNG